MLALKTNKNKPFCEKLACLSSRKIKVMLSKPRLHRDNCAVGPAPPGPEDAGEGGPDPGLWLEMDTVISLQIQQAEATS